MKRMIVLGTFAATFGTFAQAGALDPVVEEPLIIEEATSSSSGTSLVLLLAAILALPVLTD